MAAAIAHRARGQRDGELVVIYRYPDKSTKTVTKDGVTHAEIVTRTGTAQLDINGAPTATWWGAG